MHKTALLCLIFVGTAVLTFSGCATTPATNAVVKATPPSQSEINKVLWRGSQGGWIYRVDAEAVAPALDHPVQLNMAWLRNYLASLEMFKEEGDDTTDLSLFSDKQLDRLVPALVRGLARAKPGQEIVFAIAGPRPGARLFKQTVVTTGRVFVHNGRLNIIFGRVLDTVFDRAEASATYIPGTRRQARVEASRQVRSSLWAGQPKRRDWVTIAVQQGSGALPNLPESAPADTGVSTQNQPAKDEPATTHTGVRQKLETLKQLYEDDLITREEYARERAEVLDAL